MSGTPNVPGHVAKTDLQAVISGALSQLNSSPSDSPEAFIEAAMEWINRWVSKHGENAVQALAPFAIVFEPEADEGWSKAGPGWSEAWFFREELPIGIGGGIYVTTTSMLEVTGSSSGAETLSDLGNALQATTLIAQPMVVVDPANSQIVCCAEGYKGPRAAVRLDMSPLTAINEQFLDEELDRFHREHTQFPDGYTDVFQDRKGRVLYSKAESMVRNSLYLHLRHRVFRSKWIAREDFTPAGRADVAIYDTQNGNRLACVLELKVLRSRGMSKTPGAGSREYKEELMVRHVRMGIRQAQKYKHIASPPAQWAYVCAFDGRDGNTELPGIQQVADDRGVIYRRYFMDVSARDDLDI